MAGLDTSIALGIKPVDFGDPNEGRMNALRAQMMQMQMQQGQFNMMKAQRDMEYQNQQRAAAAAAVARDKAAEKEAINAFLKTAQPGYTINPDLTSKFAAGAASDIGFLGDTSQYPDLQGQRVAPTAPDMNATIQQLRDRGRFDAARKAMGQNQAFNVNESSNVKLEEERNKSKQVDFETKTKAMALHASQLPMVTQQSYASWREATLRDLPHLKDQLPEQAPADPQQFELLKRQLAAKASDVLAQNYQTITTGNQTQTVNINPITQLATPVPGTEGTTKPTEKQNTKLQQLQEYRDGLKSQLDKNPTNEMLQQKYNEAYANVAKEAKYGDKGLPPLDKGWTYNEKGEAVLIPGSKADRDERLKAVGDRKKVVGNVGQFDEAVKNIDALLDPANAKAFNDNFGGYVQRTTADKLTGATATTYQMIEKLKSSAAKLGLDDFRVNGSIGPMTVQEWPIVQKVILSLDPKMPAADAARAISDVRGKFQRMRDDAVDTYNLQWGDTKYHVPMKGGTGVQFGGAAPATAPAQGEVVQWGDLK